MGSQVTTRRKSRGRTTDREKREEETCKDKVQGTQPTIEKVMSNISRPARNHSQGPRAGSNHQKISNEVRLLEL